MQTFNIGRDAGNQIVLNDNLVSRHHALLTLSDNGQVIIKDLGSSNGTFVNGNKITQCYLNTGDVVKCGSVFLNWSQYVSLNSQPFFREEVLNSPIELYNIGTVFKYLSIRIFETGDLFKTNWNRNSSILFLKGVPVLLTFIFSIILYLKSPLNDFYFSIIISTIFSYAICPFVTIFLLSLNKNVSIDKVALGSGIMGFLQFWIGLIVLFGTFAWSYFESRSNDIEASFIFVILLTLIAIILFINLIIAHFIFIYKYFNSIGVNRSISIYLVITTLTINVALQILVSVIILLIAKNSIIYSIGNYHF